MKTLIIDGNNLIHKTARLKEQFIKSPDNAVLALVESVSSRVERSVKTIFVFDGYGTSAKKNVIFSKDKSADEIIRKFIEESQTPGSLMVISSDTHIASLAKACGCKFQKSEEFRNILDKEPSPAGKNINQNYIYDKLEKPERMSKKEIDEFKKYFT